MEIVAFFSTVVAGYLGAGILGNIMNWPDAGAVVAIAVMGTFILKYLRQAKGKDK